MEKEIIDLVPEIEVRAADTSDRSPSERASLPASTMGALPQLGLGFTNPGRLGLHSGGGGSKGRWASRPGEIVPYHHASPCAVRGIADTLSTRSLS